MADSSSGRLVSFLIEGDEVVSCEVCMEPFDPTTRPPKLLPCGHNFCEQCLFSLCCHQQYYLLDSINCPTCRSPFSTSTARSAPTNYDLCKILENVRCGELNNVTVIQVEPPKEPAVVPSTTTTTRGHLTKRVRQLAEKTEKTEINRQLCTDCHRKLSRKSIAKTARHCQSCCTDGVLKLSCLECCVDRHNGHNILSIQQIESNQLKTLFELRDIRRRLLESSAAFDTRFTQIGQKGGIQTPALHAQKQSVLSSCLSSLDDVIKNIESAALVAPVTLSQIRNEQLHNLSRLTKMNSLLEKSVQTEEKTPQMSRMKRTESTLRQSRLTLRSDDSLTREALSTLVSILPNDANSRALSLILGRISPKDTVEERKMAYLQSVQIITNILHCDVSPCDLPVFADALLNCFYQLNVLSRKRDERRETSRRNIWKAVQVAYTHVMGIASRSFAACHPERVDCLDDLAYLCHLYSDVSDQATVALLIIEAARARSSEGILSLEDRERTDQRLKTIDDHLVELRRLQRIQDLRSKTKTKRDGRLKTLWRRLRGNPRTAQRA